jgi:glycosyltransferase involved in cell wall biosynthesis
MNNKMALISIIITNYNYSRYVSRSIKSCLNQSISDKIEVIVVDDCSTDDSVNIINNNFTDIQVKKYFLEENKGVAYCSNFGIKKANGIFVMRVDSDDYIHEKMAEYLLDFLEMNQEYSFAYCDHIRVDIREVKSERIYLNDDKTLFEHGAGVLFKKSHLEVVGLYDEEMLNCEDMLLLKKLKQNNFNGIYVQLPLYRYFRHDCNMTNNVEERSKWMEEANKRIKK